MSSQTLYDKALRSYLLTKYVPAANTCNKAIAALTKDDDETLRLNIWTLYLNIASTLLVGASQLPSVKLFGIQDNNVKSFGDVCNAIWTKLTTEGYSHSEFVDPRLVSACLNLDLKLNQHTVGREIAEGWFASLPDLYLDDIANGRQSDDGYIEVVQLYTSHILPGMNDFESANTFLEYNSVLSDSKKKQLQLAVQDQQDKIEKKLAEKRKLEEAAKLAAEKKEAEREAKRLEKERKEEIERIAFLEKQKQQELEAAAELSNNKKKVEIREEQNTIITPRSTMNENRSPSALNQNLAVIKNWMGQVTAKGAASYATILIIAFALLALLRGQRGRLTIALQNIMNKLWQTIKMGTKVTYM